MAQAREGIGQIGRDRFLEHRPDQFFHQRDDFALAHERGLDIDLGEFRLPVGAQDPHRGSTW
jgi:hypothetical protein